MLLCVAFVDTNIGKEHIPLTQSNVTSELLFSFISFLYNFVVTLTVFFSMHLRVIMKEDCGAFAADCVIFCCCCECFILQVFMFAFFKVPCKLSQKMKRFATRRRFRGKKRRNAEIVLPTKEDDCREEHGSRYSCMEDIEEMMQELSMQGEFVFGSFWRQGDSANDVDFGNSQYEIAKYSNNHHSLSLLIAQDVLLDSRIQMMKR